jgi:hypothetical protein
MYRFAFAALVAAPLLMASPSFAATDIPLPPFSAINVHGGGHVILVHGASQRVTLLKGDPKVAQIRVINGNTLDISPCETVCMFRHVELEVEIVSPNIQAIEAHGGGAIDTKGEFPKQAQMSVAAHGGGSIDIRAIPVEQVSAEVHGGGAIHVKALSALSASAHGGGVITYSGDPKVAASTHGGGVISKE